MKREIFVNCGLSETRLALYEDGTLCEIEHVPAGLLDDFSLDTALARRQATARRGSIFLGRVTGIDSRLNAAFVDIGADSPGFLPARAAGPGQATGKVISGLVHEGQAILVQVGEPARDGKGARLTMRPALAGALLVFRPYGSGIDIPAHKQATADERQHLKKQAIEALKAAGRPGGGIALRSAAVHAGVAAMAGEMDRLVRLWQGIGARAGKQAVPALLWHGEMPLASRIALLAGGRKPDRIVVDHDAGRACIRRSAMWPDMPERPGPDDDFSAASLDAAIEAALQPPVSLKEGVSLVIESTAAVVAIDVNARDSGNEAARLRANLVAAAGVARQLRLRRPGGQIVVDFLEMRRRVSHRQLTETLQLALVRDPAHPFIAGHLGVGLYAIIRPRHGPSLAEELNAVQEAPSLAPGPQAAASAALRHVQAMAQERRGRLLRLEVSPVIFDMLCGGADHNRLETAISRLLGVRVEIHVRPSYQTVQFEAEWIS